ncbi:autotransporter outer membrane beta-barrel domain-containing protein [Billgrantia pellis]|uniref:Autotransporter outer membrane beta-barrel domain-containing protein n=1 Tax=Billgrantia pellis TaxID=2606936 RepID=A0A7V7KGT7_9GAMM|nr:autotransporter outer membrane beta-barrel domain-containing protein [Halomonas pellis]KAA0010824.1 autotransporter outer membrane beta-barrel domain-containing protein [Halomonas pellis]
MNKVHRTLWSHARQAWVVASEYARGNGKPVCGKAAVAGRLHKATWLIAATVGPGIHNVTAYAFDYTASNEAELRSAIAQANASGDSSSTIELTSSIALSDPVLPDVAAGRIVTIDTGAFTLTAQTAPLNSPGKGATFGSGSIVLQGSVVGGSTTSSTSAEAVAKGGDGVTANGADITNRATVTGGDGGSRLYSNQARAGDGGSGMTLSNSSLTNASTGSISGGDGGSVDVSNMPTSGGSSNSGNGGIGVQITDGMLNNEGLISGGEGGSPANSPAGGDNQWAGIGGTGAILIGGDDHNNSGTIIGGNGGTGSNLGGSGHGAGGVGVRLADGSLNNTSTGSISGADGIAGGGSVVGTGSAGGNGLELSNATLRNEGTVTGGDSAASVGAQGGGIGITGSDATIINNGQITSGRNGDGGLAYAIHFTGGTNSLELHSNSTITGNVLAATTADTLALGGSANGIFDTDLIGVQYQNFGVFNKTGTSTWALTGATSEVTSWNLLEGKLSVSDDSSLGDAAGELNFDGGILQITGTTLDQTARTINWGAAGGGFDIVDGANTFIVDQALVGGGPLSKEGAGTLVLTAENSYSGGTRIEAGVLQLGDGGNSGRISGDVLNNGTLLVDRADSLAIGGTISGNGALVQDGSGTTILSGDNTYSGATNINQGTLLVNGDQSAATGTVTVASGATLGGSGELGGTVTALNGGRISPGNSAGTLTMGNLALSSGSFLDFELGAKNIIGGTLNDLLEVNGDLTLDGTLNVDLTPGGAFDPGIYRVINYSGGMTNNTLDLGTLPAGTAPGDVYIQTEVAQQVNLINTNGLTLRFWDAQGPNNGLYDGGDGTWYATTTTNWTDSDPALNNAWTDNAFAVFQGPKGTVTVDDSLGTINFSGGQFITDGYVINGPGTLTTNTADTVIRVGDGTAAGQTTSATINANIAGTGGLMKSDVGTLVLGGENSYTGGTTVAAGTLQVASDANLGAASGELNLDGGTLSISQDFDSAREFNVLTGGGVIDTQANTVGLSGPLSGASNWSKLGSGTLKLSGTNNTTGRATVAEGTLAAGAAGAFGPAASYNVATGATLDTAGFDQLIGDLTNAGTVSLIGDVPGSTLTVQGDYIGNDGLLRMSTKLGADDSATDRLVIDGGTASGTTMVEVVNLGGLGAQTTGDGIELISAINGATTTAQSTQDAFALNSGHLAAGAFEYRLLPGDAGGAGENWYLRSTLANPSTPTKPSPVTYRPEIALNAVLPSMLTHSDMTMLGTRHLRLGDDGSGTPKTTTDLSQRVWARYIHNELENRQSGTVSPNNETEYSGVQLGLDLLHNGSERLGLYAGRLEWNGEVNGFASGVSNNSVGDLAGHSNYAGTYWIHTGESGWYSDLVLQYGWHNGDASSNGGSENSLDGNSLMASLEVGKPFALNASWGLEPQAQVIVGRQDLDTASISAAKIVHETDTTMTGRLGLRLVGDFQTNHGRVQPYGRINLWHGLNGTDEMLVYGPGGSTTIDTKRGYTSGEVAVGATWSVSDRINFYGEVGRLEDVGGNQEISSSYNLSAGARITW